MVATVTSTAGVAVLCKSLSAASQIVMNSPGKSETLLHRDGGLHRINRIQNRFAGRWCAQRWINAMFAHCRHRIADRQEHRERQQQRWFAGRLGAMDGVRNVAVLEQVRTKIRRAI